MRKICEFIFALATIAFIEKGFAQSTRQSSGSRPAWQVYDSLAAAEAFNGDTLTALEHYRHSLELNPHNDYTRKNYERLSFYFITSGQSFYYINP